LGVLGRSPEAYHQAGLRWGTATSSSTKTGTTSDLAPWNIEVFSSGGFLKLE